jgi:hypothetical protein
VLKLLGVPPQTFKREYFIEGDDQPTIVRQLVPVEGRRRKKKEERRKKKEERRKKKEERRRKKKEERRKKKEERRKKKKATPKRIPKNSKSNQLQLVDVDTTE